MLIESLLHARLHDPFALLGLHREGNESIIRIYDPRASNVALLNDSKTEPLKKVHPGGLFEWRGVTPPPSPYRVRISEGSASRDIHDPYQFPSHISEQDLYLFSEGRLHQAYRTLGSHSIEIDGVQGVRFAVWAPNAERVSVVGEFNNWDGRLHLMRSHGSSGVWETFIPGIKQHALYRYEIRNRATGQVTTKIDPYAQGFELRPGTAALTAPANQHQWKDQAWMAQRAKWDWLHGAINIYEVHAGSWKRHPDGRFYTFSELATDLVPYVKGMGYTHIEFMPVTEHPLDESWGYQCTGYFAPSSRFGSPDELRQLIDACHQADIGVILDWVPAHFPQDSWALARYDGTALYEHEDPRLGMHMDWGTHIFNFGRNEVKSFLMSSAHYWLSEFHFDGLRVDAVASMLYLDYSREAGQWIPNKYGGRENLEAVDFLREMNVMVHDQFPGALTMAEESTAWPGVSRPVYLGGLGFSVKWNMGWMNDTLKYFQNDPVHRRYHHNQLTFGQIYAYSENFVMPFSHDEVVHGKGSLISKMPGDAWQKFANLRLLLTYQMTSPGKKLNFMGNEIAQGREWQSKWELEWWQLREDYHRGMQNLTHDLNELYRTLPALHDQDFQSEGFAWIDCNDAEKSVLSFQRSARDGSIVVVSLNLTPVPRKHYRIGLPKLAKYREALNSDSDYYAGSNLGNAGLIEAEEIPWMGLPYSAEISLPPLAGMILVPEA
ncbi:MAG: 1,4-alpha-glucan branching protein GlgB [Gallionella sp.]|nr:1,4-alpha-glucan branching protein GlgB [Gallionella sp.]MDD4946489.1 1,4-alpha-glucan branching protein GlgB [Gallionella sp.]MDD5612292.1 1,4-alpha-glucan branching protein GlgB [Gallionella sp.]